MNCDSKKDFRCCFFWVFFQDSSDSVRQTEKATAGEAGVRSRGGEEQKGNVLLIQSDVVV